MNLWESNQGLCWVPECKEVQHIAVNCPLCKSRWRLARGWFAGLAANPETRTEEPRWDSRTGGDIGNRHGGMLPPEPLELLPWELRGEPCNPKIRGNRRAIFLLEPLITGPWGLPEALNGGLEASIKRPPGLVENGPFQGFWGVGPWGGVFSATKYVPLIPWGVLRKGFSPF